MKIDLISDTVTKPTKEMLNFAFQAEVGDDVFEADPTVNLFQYEIAKYFNHEKALFCPSGTMANQIALKLHTKPLDEVVCDHSSHIFQYEVAGYSFHSQIAINPILTVDGKLRKKDIEECKKPIKDWLPRTTLVCLENSCNRGGGNYYTLDEMTEISALCKTMNLKLHLDGARIFNVIVAEQIEGNQIGPLFDSMSVCMSKGLGAPMGSVLLGSADFIAEARRIRKVMGGGGRQMGYMAAAALYALNHNVKRLRHDHDNAKSIEQILQHLSYVESVKPVYTNIIIFDLKEHVDVDHFIQYLADNSINASGFGKRSVRFVTHLNIEWDMLGDINRILIAYQPA